MPQVTLRTQGSFIMVDPSSLYVHVADTIEFVSSDGADYDVVIPNRDKFFVSSNGATIEEAVNSTTSPVTPEVNDKPIGTKKYYSVSTPGGGMPYAPPRIIIIPSQ